MATDEPAADPMEDDGSDADDAAAAMDTGGAAGGKPGKPGKRKVAEEFRDKVRVPATL